MKKQVKKLSLNRETVSALTQVEGAAITATAWSNCYCTAMSACCTNGCPSALCW